MTTRLLAPSALFALAACLAGCAKADYIQVDPDIVIFRSKGESVWMRGLVMSNSGTSYPKSTVTWSVKDPSVATVDETGKVLPVKSGSTEVVASFRDVRATVPVEVLFPEKMVVEPAALELTEDGEPLDIRVKVYDYLGRELKDRGASFQSRNKEVLSMGQNAAHPGKAGKTQVEVRVGDLVKVLEVTVKNR